MPLAPEHNGTDGTKRKDHYGEGKQPWDTIKEMGWAPAFAASNVIKYLRRTKDPEHSLESARWYDAQLRAMVRETNSFENPFIEEIWNKLQNELTPGEHARLRGDAVT